MCTNKQKEFFIVIDVETAGPSPSIYPLLSIGACTLTKPRKTFYVELQPDSDSYKPEALNISNLSLEKLAQEGTAPEAAMQQFNDWVKEVAGEDKYPVFTAFNAPFDWMFVNEYFYRYLGYNPFGHSALDIKAYYMGRQNICWRDTSFRKVSIKYNKSIELHHHALADAIDAADLFEQFLQQKGVLD